MRDFLLSYDTVTLYPNHSNLPSRNDADTTVNFCGWKFNLPVVPANMKDVINPKLAKLLSENGYFYIYHRFGQNYEDNSFEFVRKANEENWKLISISVGVNAESRTEILKYKALRKRVDFITIDVAHGHHDKVKSMVDYIRENLPKTKIISGNIATDSAAEFLYKSGVDALKVGIGGGSICTTRYMTGFHMPTLESIYRINLSSCPLPLIADGGAKHFGDVAKALTFGASMVMSGGWFASCIDSPANMVDGKKVYRGSTSYELKGHKTHVEGKQLELVNGSTYEEKLVEIKQALQSSISYAGGKDLNAFKLVTWGRILPFH